MSIFKKYRGPLQYIQFSMIGGLNALVDIGALNLFLMIWPTDASRNLLLFNTLSYSLAILNSYLWNTRLTFRYEVSMTIKEKVAFLIQAIASLIISNLVFIGSVKLLGLVISPKWLALNISKGLAMFLSSTASFFFMKYFVFRKNRSS